MFRATGRRVRSMVRNDPCRHDPTRLSPPIAAASSAAYNEEQSQQCFSSSCLDTSVAQNTAAASNKQRINELMVSLGIKDALLRQDGAAAGVGEGGGSTQTCWRRRNSPGRVRQQKNLEVALLRQQV